MPICANQHMFAMLAFDIVLLVERNKGAQTLKLISKFAFLVSWTVVQFLREVGKISDDYLIGELEGWPVRGEACE